MAETRSSSLKKKAGTLNSEQWTFTVFFDHPTRAVGPPQGGRESGIRAMIIPLGLTLLLTNGEGEENGPNGRHVAC